VLNPSDITNAVAATLAAIPDLAAAMTVVDSGGNPTIRITPFHYLLGQDHRLAEAIEKMPAPSILCAWEGTFGGNFNGYSIWKHKVVVYIRMGNAAGNLQPVGYEQLWWLICNGIPTTSTQNIRYTNLLPALDIMDTPTATHLLDAELMDIFRTEFVIPEIGDN
jgi:hypothetical protein